MPIGLPKTACAMERRMKTATIAISGNGSMTRVNLVDVEVGSDGFVVRYG